MTDIDLRPLFRCDVLVIREDPYIEIKHRYHHKLVTTWIRRDASGLCTPSRACNLTAAGKTNKTEDEDEATYQASQ